MYLFFYFLWGDERTDGYGRREGMCLNKVSPNIRKYTWMHYMAVMKRLKNPENRNWKMNFVTSCDFCHKTENDFPLQTENTEKWKTFSLLPNENTIFMNQNVLQSLQKSGWLSIHYQRCQIISMMPPNASRQIPNSATHAPQRDCLWATGGI